MDRSELLRHLIKTKEQQMVGGFGYLDISHVLIIEKKTCFSFDRGNGYSHVILIAEMG